MTTPDKSKRRARGDGGLHWDDKRQRWIASVTIGYTPAGKRMSERRATSPRPRPSPS
jgi:hypothetical protein